MRESLPQVYRQGERRQKDRKPKPIHISDVARRAIDILGSFFGLLVLSPLFVMVAFMIKRDSEGPAFYGGNRVGRHGLPFKILKFRTMYERPESYQGSKVTGSNDSRITPIGQWLRDTKLNELPQLWNVLVGEMSLVGPRPEDPDFVKRWSKEEQQTILSVRPGITSPTSIIYRDEESMLNAETVIDEYIESIMPSKLRLDMLYVRHRTLLSDLDVILWTLVTLLPRLRDKKISETRIMWGPFSEFVGRHFSWLIVDFCASLIAVVISGILWRSSGSLDLGVARAITVAFGIALTFSFVTYILRLHRVQWSRAKARRGIELLFSASIVTIGLLLVNQLWQPVPLLPVGMIIMTGVLAFGGFLTGRYRTRLITGIASRWTVWRGTRQNLGERVLVIGAGAAGEAALWMMGMDTLRGAFSIVGFVDDAPSNQGLEIRGVPVLGGVSDLTQLVKEQDIGVLAFAIRAIDSAEKERILDLCRQTGLPLVMIPNILDLMQAQLPHNGLYPTHRNGLLNELDVALTEISVLIANGSNSAAHEKVLATQQLILK